MFSLGRKIRTQPRLVRLASTAHGPAEPLTPYLKWVAVVSGCIGLITYDRFYSDGAISKRLTPASNAAENREEVFKALEKQWEAQQRPITFFDTRQRTTHLENFSSTPVPVGGVRAEHSSDVVPEQSVGERRPRSS